MYGCVSCMNVYSDALYSLYAELTSQLFFLSLPLSLSLSVEYLPFQAGPGLQMLQVFFVIR